MAKSVCIADVCKEIFAGGDVPKSVLSYEKTAEYNVPIFSNGEKNCGLYGYTNNPRVKEPSITVSARGTIGYTAIRTEPFVPVVRLITLTPKSEVIDLDYLFYATQNYKFEGSGTSIPQLTVPMLKKYKFPLPEMSHQKAIAVKFEKLDQLISLRKQQLAKLDELVKARFVEKSKEWQAVLGQLNEFLDDITYGFTNPMPDAEEGPWKVTAKDVVNGHINILTARKTTNEAFERLTNKSKPRKGDVLLTKDGTLGRVAVVDVENLCVNQSVAVMRCNNKIYPEFLAMILQMPEYQRKLLEDSGGGTIKHLYITKVDKMLISVPDLVIQKDLLMFAKRVEQQKQTVQQSLEKLELMKKALMQEYFG